MALKSTEDLKVEDGTTAEEKYPETDATRVYDNYFSGTSKDDSFKGRGGNDFMLSSPGGDFFDGSGGSDWVSYENSKGGVTVDLKSGVGQGGFAKGDSYANVENAIGSEYNDVLIGNEEDNILKGEDGDDIIVAGGGYDQIRGGDGDDIIYVSEDASFVDGGNGFDLLNYSNWSHRIYFHDDEPGILPGGMKVTNIEGFVGTSFGDEIHAENELPYFDGADGADTVYIYDSTKSFEFHGGAGSDTLNATNRTDGLTWDLSAGKLISTESGEVLGSFDGVDVFRGGDQENIFIQGDSSTNMSLHGGDASDIFYVKNTDFGGVYGGSASVSYLNALNMDTISFELADKPIGSSEGVDDYILGYDIRHNAYAVEILKGTDFNDNFSYIFGFYQFDGGAGDDTLYLNEDVLDVLNYENPYEGEVTADHVDLIGGIGSDWLDVQGLDGAVVDLASETATTSFGDATVQGIENVVLRNSDASLIGNDADNEFILFDYDYENGVLTADSYDEASSANILGGGGNDVVHALFHTSANGTKALSFDGGEGFDTLSYAATSEQLVDVENVETIEDLLVGLEINVANGTVQQRLSDNIGQTHHFENVESFEGSQLADVFVDGEGSQTYLGGDLQLDSGDISGLIDFSGDKFVFSNSNSDGGDVDTILDFTVGLDKIDVSGTSRDDWDEILDGNWYQDGADTVIDLGQGHDLVLAGVDFTTLSDSDFIFG